MIPKVQSRYTPLYSNNEVKRTVNVKNGSLPCDTVSFRSIPKLHKELCSDIWQGDRLMPEVALRLKMLAGTFQKSLAMDFKRKDLAIVGSMVNFNYGKNSDIDLHLVTDFSQYPVDGRLLADYFRSKRDMFNYTNSFRIYGHPVEVSIEDASDLAHSNGRYSIERGVWVKKPVLEEAVVPVDVTRDPKYIELKRRLDDCIENKRLDKVTPLFQEIYTLRQAALAQGGEQVELSVGNMIFKSLRNEGYIKKMIDLSYAALNNLISL